MDIAWDIIGWLAHSKWATCLSMQYQRIIHASFLCATYNNGTSMKILACDSYGLKL